MQKDTADDGHTDGGPIEGAPAYFLPCRAGKGNDHFCCPPGWLQMSWGGGVQCARGQRWASQRAVWTAQPGKKYPGAANSIWQKIGMPQQWRDNWSFRHKRAQVLAPNNISWVPGGGIWIKRYSGCSFTKAGFQGSICR